MPESMRQRAALGDDYGLVGAANTSLASAERAAKAFGLPHASSPEI